CHIVVDLLDEWRTSQQTTRGEVPDGHGEFELLLRFHAHAERPQLLSIRAESHRFVSDERHWRKNRADFLPVFHGDDHEAALGPQRDVFSVWAHVSEDVRRLVLITWIRAVILRQGKRGLQDLNFLELALSGDIPDVEYAFAALPLTHEHRQ